MIKINGIYKKGFTLIELLVVIAIIAFLIGIALPNYVGSRARARDSKKKQEMQSVKTALRLYYNDYQRYPASSTNMLRPLASLRGCGTSGISDCPSGSCSVDFSAGGTNGCDNTYMKKFPFYATTLQYRASASGDDFRLSVVLENASDSDLGNSQLQCPSNWSDGTPSGASCTGNTYCVCGD